MARLRWLTRLRHSASSHHMSLLHPPGTQESTALLAAFLDAPAVMDLRPAVRSMTRDVALWFLGHPAVHTAAQARELRTELMRCPELTRVLDQRLAAFWALLQEAREDGVDLPPMSLSVGLTALADGSYDDSLRLMFPGSVVQIDAEAARHDMETALAGAANLRNLGIRVGCSALNAVPEEFEVVRRIAPDMLVLDLAEPMDYRDRLPHVLRLRAEAGASPDVVVGGVSGAVDEWAAVTCGATHLMGPLYDTEELSVLTDPSRKPLSWTIRPDGGTLTPYEVAAERHPTQTDTLAGVLSRLPKFQEAACDAGERADVYISHAATDDEGNVPSSSLATLRRLVDCGAAVTVVAPRLSAPPVPGVTWGALADDDPMAQGWVFVALVPGAGHLIAAYDVGDGGEMLSRRFAFVEADDREVAIRIAGRISRAATGFSRGTDGVRRHSG